MTTAAATPRRPTRPAFAAGTAPLAVPEGAAPLAVPDGVLLGETTVAVREVVAGAVAVETADDTDEATDEATELSDELIEETTEETLEAAELVAGADVVGAAVAEPADVDGCWPRQLESELC